MTNTEARGRASLDIPVPVAEGSPPSTVMTVPTEIGNPIDRSGTGARPVSGSTKKAWDGRVRSLLVRHRLFLVTVSLAALLRVLPVLGYRPAMWFNDSFEYVSVALDPKPHLVRPGGYAFYLWLLKPFHSFALVVGLQHLMGLGIGVIVYALLRRFRLPRWGATLAAAPALFDAYQIQLEHLVLSDVLFTLLIVGAIALALAKPRPSLTVGVSIGLLLAAATLTRSIGIPILALVLAYLLIQRVRWRVLAATALVSVVPLVAYMGWFQSWHGRFALTTSEGVFLYARVMAFADCRKTNATLEEAVLCTSDSPVERPLSQYYVWSPHSPLHRIPGGTFSPDKNDLAGRFARRAIKAQPGDYFRAVAADFAKSFRWQRRVFPEPLTYGRYEFSTTAGRPPAKWATGPGNPSAEVKAYEHGNPSTKIHSPWADLIRGYQRHFYLRGTLLGVVLLIGLAGLLARWRRLRWTVALPWTGAMGLLLIPPVTVEFDYRYVLPAVPLACLAAAITLHRILRS